MFPTFFDEVNKYFINFQGMKLITLQKVIYIIQ